jgi:hypothetical protein
LKGRDEICLLHKDAKDDYIVTKYSQAHSSDVSDGCVTLNEYFKQPFSNT